MESYCPLIATSLRAEKGLEQMLTTPRVSAKSIRLSPHLSAIKPVLG